ncbi:MAG: protein phosphatase 2C domain-containing protein [Acidobacteriota bacterium]|nr:protein phosphatase 2C domain-containing protein [Acidobacteriota bacterium]
MGGRRQPRSPEDTVLIRLCPSCQVEIPSEDRFCEDCGTRLEAPPSAPPACPKCGAKPEEIDTDGYCESCGFRRIADRRDHIEVSIAPGFEGASDRGLRHHRNEDALAMDVVDDAHIVVICDGVSSTEDADKASEAAAEAAFRSLVQSVESGHETRRTALMAAIAKASNAVIAQGTAATTVVVAVERAGLVDIAWLGDSRAYWIPRQGPALRLTEDHTESPDSHVITKWLGVDAPEDQVASTARFTIPGDGWLLLCTDGLWNYLPDPAEAIQAGAGVRDLIAYANNAGGQDNITAALWSPPLPSKTAIVPEPPA